VPPLALIGPEELKDVLVEDGYTVIFENEFHWFLAKDAKQQAPINIPREPGEDGCVSMEIMEHVRNEAQISYHKYFEIKKRLKAKAN
jgi:hypothetical protein